MNDVWRRLAVAGHGGDGATARAALDDADADTRGLALGALDRAGQLRDDDLVHALDDAQPTVRRRAVELAARRPGVDLGASLDDPDPTVREMAAWACGEREDAGEPTTTTATMTRLNAMATGDGDALVREAAVAALGAIGDERGLDAILHGTTDRPAIRRRAVLALAAFTDQRAIDALRAAAGDRDWQTRQAAEDLLAIVDGHRS